MVNKCKLLLGCAHDEVCLAIISSLLFRFIALVVLKAILSPSVHVGVVPQPSCLCALGWQPNLPHLASLSPQPPVVKTEMVTISDTFAAQKTHITTKEVPIVHTETKTITYEAAQVHDAYTHAHGCRQTHAHTLLSQPV